MDDSGRDAGPKTERAGASLSPVDHCEQGAVGGSDSSVPPSRPTFAAQTRGEGRGANLSAALRRARIDNAERSSGVADLRGAEIARLEILREQLEPILAQVPRDCDLFDIAISPSERPRLFIDAIGFVEMGHDRRSYRFSQDTRHGLIEICVNDRAENLVEAITAYIAHRLVEREKALASDFASGAGAAQAARAAALRAQPWHEAAKGLALPRKAMEIYLRAVEAIVALVTLILLLTLAGWAFARLGGAAP
jgi:hypothetical protein